MTKKAFAAAVFVVFALAAEPAAAHHVMGGRMPASFAEGLRSGFGHPVAGLDHFAAVVAIGCLAAAHRSGPTLAAGFVVAMMAGVVVHVRGTTVPVAEILVALTAIALAAVLLWKRDMPAGAALASFAVVGLIHGYALGLRRPTPHQEPGRKSAPRV